MSPGPGGARPLLHVVTDDRVLAAPGFDRIAEGLLDRGGTALALHLRGPGTPGGPLLARAAPLAVAASRAGALLVVNDRVDVALAAGAHGVHLGRRSLPVEEARRILRGRMDVGVSVHDPDGARAAEADGVAWCFVGTVFATPSHPGRPGGGAGLLREARAAAPMTPLVAIGGVSPGRVAPVLEAGADGVAVIRGIWDAPDPLDALDEYLDRLAAGRGPAREGA